MDRLAFDLPAAWQLGLPVAGLVLAFGAWALRRRGLPPVRAALLTLLRAGTLLALVLLLSRPAWVESAPPANPNRTVVVLVDRSESMSLEEGAHSRFHQAREYLRSSLLPALDAAGLPVQAMVFAEDAESVDGPALLTSVPNGRRTHLGGAIARALGSTPTPPLAVVALTDGLANEYAENARALSGLVENQVPFVGIGFGSETGARTLSLRRLDAPVRTATNTTFRLSAELEMTSADEIPPFQLVLLRDGKMLETRTITPGTGSRLWRESFSVTEPEEGLRQYLVQFLPPAAPGLKCANTLATARVQVTSEKEIRVLYVQGALTWDYKFITRAVQGDPSIRLTGSTRTSQQSVFRQGIEGADELARGFPVTLEELAPFRIVVLAELTPAELNPDHQELLARFCGELGGGLLLIGGSATFNSGWKGTRLEQVLPVTLSAHPGITGLDRPFRLQLTPEALAHPLFRIVDDAHNAEAWAALPTFSQYGRLDAAKPGAQVWAEHPDDDGPGGKRILMASQRYGSGLAAVVAVQNLWRWRLARDSNPAHFDRFWRQLLRYLGEPNQSEIYIDLEDQDLRPGSDIRLAIERRPQPGDDPATRQTCQVEITDDRKRLVASPTVELAPARPAPVSFHAEDPGVYSVRVLDESRRELAARHLEIRDTNLEFLEAARNMETLRQWASLSGGFAFEAEHCPPGADLVARLRNQAETLRLFKPRRRPAGINPPFLLLVLGCLVAEWSLRRRWLST